MKLKDALGECSLGLLRRIGQEHGVSFTEDTLRVELAESIADALSRPGYLARYLDLLPPLEHLAVQIVANAGGQMLAHVLERRLRARVEELYSRGQLPDVTTPVEVTDRTERAIPQSLLHRGVLFRSLISSGPLTGEVYHLPEEVLQALPRPDLKVDPGPRAILDLRPPPTLVYQCDPSFDLFALASFLRRQHTVPAPRDRDQATGVRLDRFQDEMAALVHEVAPCHPLDRWRFLAHLGLRAGVLERLGGNLVPTRAMQDLMDQDRDVALRLWKTYLRDPTWNDVVRSGAVRTEVVGRPSDPATARRELTGLLAILEAGEWVTPSSLIAMVRSVAPDFLRQRYEDSASGLLDLASGAVLSGPASWEKVEGTTIRYMLAGPLYWLGIVAWGVSNDGTETVSLTEHGAACLRETSPALRPRPEHASVGDDLVVRVPRKAHLGLLYRLEPYLTLVSRGHISVYRLSQSSFGEAVQSGGSAQELTRLLGQLTGGPLPASVTNPIAEWTSRVGQVQVRPVVLLSTADDEVARCIASAERLAPMIREKLGARAFVVSGSQVDELVAELRDLGYIPHVDSALRLMAGRRAYAGLVDQQVLELLFFSLRLLARVYPGALARMGDGEDLLPRLRAALRPDALERLERAVDEEVAAIQQGRRGRSRRRRPSPARPAMGE